MSRSLTDDCRRFGWITVLWREIFRYLRQWAGLRFYGIYSRQLKREGQSSLPPDFSIKFFTADNQAELLAFAKRPELGITQEFVSAAMAKGDICCAIIHKDEIVSFDWSALNPPALVERNVYLDFAAKSRYAYFGYTLPAFRGLHLPRIFIYEKDSFFIKLGYHHSISFIAIYNLSSIKYATALGNHCIGYAGFILKSRFFLAFRSPAIAKAGLRFYRMYSL